MEEMLKPMKGFTFGSDPELFILDQNGEPVSAVGIIPGDKSNPYPVNGGAVQCDGMAAEYNTNPAKTYEEFEDNTETVLGELRKFLPTGYTLAALPSVVFSQKAWDAAPDEAKVLGCSPDFNAWTGGVNPPPEDVSNPTMRCAGGHLHIGWTSGAGDNIQHIRHCQDLVRQLDCYLGYWSLVHDTDPTRRRLYGKAGACRYKDYGVEYRTLSNFWVLDREIRREMWNRMVKAVSDMRTDYFPERKEYSQLVVEAIDSSTRHTVLESVVSFPLISPEKEKKTSKLGRSKMIFVDHQSTGLGMTATQLINSTGFGNTSDANW